MEIKSQLVYFSSEQGEGQPAEEGQEGLLNKSFSSQHSSKSNHSFSSRGQRQTFERSQAILGDAYRKEAEIRALIQQRRLNRVKQVSFAGSPRQISRLISQIPGISPRQPSQPPSNPRYKVFELGRLVTSTTTAPTTAGTVVRLDQEPADLSSLKPVQISDVPFRRQTRQAEIPAKVSWQSSHNSFSSNYFRVCQLTQQQYMHTSQMLKSRPFQDHQFPPVPRSFGLTRCQMRRAGEFKCRLWKQFEAAGIVPGQRATPALLSALACLSPQLIVNLFEHQKINSQGLYFLKLFRQNVWRYVLLDDYLPFQNSTPLSTITKTGEVWPSLVEKGLYKVFGLAARSVQFYLECLTGGFVRTSRQVERFGENYIVLGRAGERGPEIGIPKDFAYLVVEREEDGLTFRNAFGWLSKEQNKGGIDFKLKRQQIETYFTQFITCQLFHTTSSYSQQLDLKAKATRRFTADRLQFIKVQQSPASNVVSTVNSTVVGEQGLRVTREEGASITIANKGAREARVYVRVVGGVNLRVK